MIKRFLTILLTLTMMGSIMVGCGNAAKQKDSDEALESFIDITSDVISADNDKPSADIDVNQNDLDFSEGVPNLTLLGYELKYGETTLDDALSHFGVLETTNGNYSPYINSSSIISSSIHNETEGLTGDAFPHYHDIEAEHADAYWNIEPGAAMGQMLHFTVLLDENSTAKLYFASTVDGPQKIIDYVFVSFFIYECQMQETASELWSFGNKLTSDTVKGGVEIEFNSENGCIDIYAKDNKLKFAGTFLNSIEWAEPGEFVRPDLWNEETTFNTIFPPN